MASKPLRPCRKPRCAALTREGWCADHKPPSARHGKSAVWHGLYSLRLWTDDLRPYELLREPFCRECAARGIRTRAAVADHITPHRGDMALFSSRDNLQSLCKRHHDAKTMRELREEIKSR